MIKIGRRGSLNGDIIVVHGKQGHSAYPQQADNPVPVLARIVTALTETALLMTGTEVFDPTRLVVTSMDVGNPARNVIPGEATREIQRAIQRYLDSRKRLKSRYARRSSSHADGAKRARTRRASVRIPSPSARNAAPSPIW